MKHSARIRGIMSARVYSFADVAYTLSVHIRTVQNWHRKGLKPVDEKSRPFLVSGKEIIRFLNDRKSRKRFKLKGGEYYCLACRAPRLAAPGTETIKPTGRRLGNGKPQILKSGTCQVCGKEMNKLAAYAVIDMEESYEASERYI